MKLHTHSSIFPLTAAVMFVGGAVQAQAAPAAAEQVIRPIMARMFRDANAHDTERFMEPFLHSSSLVFAINGVVIRGWDALDTQQLKWWQHGKSNAHYSQDGSIEFMGLAPDIEITTWRLYSRRVQQNGKVSASAFVATYVWRWLPHGWRIVYGHESWANPPR